MRVLVVTTTIVLSILLDLAGAHVLLAANSNSLLIGKAVYGDWRSDAPGIRRYIKASDLPAPYASNSAANSAVVVGKPADARLNVPFGFEVKLLASGLDQPRLIRVAPNGDVFVAESSAGRIRVLKLSDNGDEINRNEIFASGLKLPFGIVTAGAGPPSFIVLANYLPVGGAMACPMRANSRRPWIAA